MEGWLEIRRAPDGLSRGEQTAAWQAVVRERLGERIYIRYGARGEPEVFRAADGERAGFIGVSHTKGWIAVIYSPTKPCAVDIELRSRALPTGAAERYGLRSMEDWCAREARYKHGGEKFGGEAPVEFLEHPELVIAIIK